MIEPGDALHEGSRTPADLLRLKGATETELYLVGEVQKVYKSQGVEIHDKHIELIVRQMLKKVRVDNAGETDLLPGQLVDKVVLDRENARVKKEKKEQATSEPLILGITKASLATESFLSAASFQETTKVLTDAAIEGKVDRLGFITNTGYEAMLEIAGETRPEARGILDVGCGTGRLLRAAAEVLPDARLFGVDAARDMVEVARASAPAGSRIEFRQSMAEALPFEDAAFDLVVSTMTFHHWADQWRGVAEVGRVMRPDGRWLLADFVASGLMKYVKRLFRLRRFRERRDLEAVLRVAGVRIASSRKGHGVGGQGPVLVIGKA